MSFYKLSDKTDIRFEFSVFFYVYWHRPNLVFMIWGHVVIWAFSHSDICSFGHLVIWTHSVIWSRTALTSGGGSRNVVGTECTIGPIRAAGWQYRHEASH